MPVPPEELQATADALQPRHHRPHPRNRPQSRNNDSSANASSGSGEISQRSSRPHSVRTSASHSRVSSRTGSAHTSPRYNPANRTLYDTPEVPPPVPHPEPFHNSRYLHPNPPVDNSMNSPYAYSYSPVEGSSTGVLERFSPRPNFQSHGMLFIGSSSQHYYSGSAGYENHPVPHPPLHISGPPHLQHVPNYQQPQLGPGHAYPHLSQPTPHRPSCSALAFTPVPPAQVPSESRIPLPTMLTRPPLPEHSAAVDGYRDVGAALSTNPPEQQILFGHIRPQANEGSINTSAPSPELAVNVADETIGNTLSEPRLPPFTVGGDPGATAKGRKLRKVGVAGDSTSVGDSSVRTVTDRTNPEVTFQFGVFSPPDATPGSTPGQVGASEQAGSVELDSLRSNTGDEWQVRDFGYGFGHMSGSGNAAAVIRDEINAREQRRAHERKQREEQERKQKEEQEQENSEGPPDRPRRGSFNGGYERGGYSNRRGRGPNGGYGRGYGRGFSRGGYGQYQRQQHQYSATPPAQFSQLPSHAPHGYSPDQSVYFLPPPPPPPPSFGSYLPGGYEVYQYPSFPPPPPLYPPVPQPVSQLLFSLDPTRYYLLGQLEYYLSPQNMAQDFYLRQQASPAKWCSGVNS